jgi:small GTP-binding protein
MAKEEKEGERKGKPPIPTEVVDDHHDDQIREVPLDPGQMRKPSDGDLGPSNVIKKIIVVGDTGVGKKTIVSKIAPFIRDLMLYTEKIGTAVTKYKLNYKTPSLDVDMMIIVWDVTGKPEYQHLYESYYRGAEGAVVMCDAANLQSIENVPLWIKVVIDFCGMVPLVVVVNKIDKVNDLKRKAIDKQLRALIHKYDPPLFYTARDMSFEKLKLPFYTLADLLTLRFMDQVKQRRFRKANIRSVVRDKGGGGEWKPGEASKKAGAREGAGHDTEFEELPQDNGSGKEKDQRKDKDRGKGQQR